MALSDQEQEKRARALRHAVAQQRLEGLDVPPAVLDELHRAVAGEMSIAEGIANVYHRYGRTPPDTPRSDTGGQDGDT